jgi:hypothetical protein
MVYSSPVMSQRYLNQVIIVRLRLLILAIVLIMPGVAQAVAGTCAHETAARVSTVINFAKTMASDCHETAKLTHERTGHDQQKSKSCCASGTSCAGAQALLSISAIDTLTASAVLPTPGALPSYASRNLLPDYPPPRV